jgi:hypothetical protein
MENQVKQEEKETVLLLIELREITDGDITQNCPDCAPFRKLCKYTNSRMILSHYTTSLYQGLANSLLQTNSHVNHSLIDIPFLPLLE